MKRNYFLVYKTDQTEAPYQLPEEIRQRIASIPGVEITYEREHNPLLIVKISDDKVEEVRSLEGIMLFESKKYAPF